MEDGGRRPVIVRLLYAKWRDAIGRFQLYQVVLHTASARMLAYVSVLEKSQPSKLKGAVQRYACPLIMACYYPRDSYNHPTSEHQLRAIAVLLDHIAVVELIHLKFSPAASPKHRHPARFKDSLRASITRSSAAASRVKQCLVRASRVKMSMATVAPSSR